MNKRVYEDIKNKVVVVTISDECGYIIAKGIAKCSPEDEFDLEKGRKLANTRAWIKYYKKVLKDKQFALRRIDNWMEACKLSKKQAEESIETITAKQEKLLEDYNDLMSNL